MLGTDQEAGLGAATRSRSDSLAVPTPARVFAFALGAEVLVKWLTPREVQTSKPTVRWLVNRYRKQQGDWRLKGSFDVAYPQSIGPGGVFQAVATQLKPDALYRFTVQRVRSVGKDDESDLSNAVLLTPDLPDPWMPLYDEASDMCVFVHLRTKEQATSRPEGQPYFVDEDLRICFSSDEMASFRTIFNDAMYRYGTIDVSCMRRLLYQLGEVVDEKRMEDIMAVITDQVLKPGSLYSRLLMLAQVQQRTITITNFQQFVACLHTVKMRCVRRRVLARRVWAHTWWAMYGAMVARNLHVVLHAARVEEDNRYSPWEKHDDGKQRFYVQQATNTIQWAPPKHLYYFLPQLLEEQLQRCFSLSEIETLKTYFAEVDFDEDGIISMHQLLAVLEAMQFYCDGFVTEHILPMLRRKGHTSFDFKLVCWIFCVLRLFLSDDGSKFHVLAQPQLWPYLRSDLVKHVAKRKVDGMLKSMHSSVEPPFYTPSDNTYPHGRVCLCGCRAHLVPRTFETS